MDAIESQALQNGNSLGLAALPPPDTKTVIIAPEEQTVVQVEQGGGVYRDQSGRIATSDAGGFRAFATSLGYDPSVANDGFAIAEKNRGIVGLACSNVDLINVLNDLVSHMKGKLNSNSEDLELVFAIDYSGSMNDNIEYVPNRLTDFAKNLQSIKASGRCVRVAIATFGKSGRERIELSLTDDLMKFSRKLQDLLQNYSSNKHSADPGEAIYHGLRLISDQIAFTSVNRQVVAITDEGSYELETGDSNYVLQAQARMTALNVYPLLVRYCS